ncbi:hypothetical protein C0J52_09410 [Blattella germanica]|nr:hypothetical protein C0J52_09410 [Blattella germanica]
MVALEANTQDTECLKNPMFQVIRPRALPWYQNMGSTPNFTKNPASDKSGLDLTHSSAFRPVGPEYRAMKGWLPGDQPDDTTQVTWSSAQRYICSVTVSKSAVGWNRNSVNVISQSSEESSNKKKAVDEEDEDEEIDVGDSYDTQVPIPSDKIDHSISSADLHHDTLSKINSESGPNVQPSMLPSGNQSIGPKFAKHLFNNDPLARRNSSPAVYVHSKQTLKTFSDSNSMEFEISAPEVPHYSNILNGPIKPDPGETPAPRKSIISTNTPFVKLEEPPTSEQVRYDVSNKQVINPSVIRISPELVNLSGSHFTEYRRSSEISSPDITGSTDSLCSLREDMLQRRSTLATIEYLKPRCSIASYSTGSSESLCSSKGDVFERRKSFGSIDYAKASCRSIGSCPTDSTDSLASISGDILHRRLTLCSLDFKRPSGSLSSYRTDSSESICSSNGDVLQWRTRVGSADSIRRPTGSTHPILGNIKPRMDNVHDYKNFSIRKEEIFDKRESIISAWNQNIYAVTKVPYSKASEEKEIDLSKHKTIKHSSLDNIQVPAIEVTNSGKNVVHFKETIQSTEPPTEQKFVDIKETPNITIEQQRESVVVEPKSVKIEKDIKPVFSPEDLALRSRVLILLWVLLGERRLREVGFPADPVHRILWRAVDVCCSVAGVKSAAAVPLNADHDCGSDMLCFRDHAHRFLEVCAPTREHWKQFGWASLTVDAVVRKIYDEELIPLLRTQPLPPDIQKAVAYLAQMDRPSVMVQHNSSQQKQKGNSHKQPLIILPAKKKRGRPAKITHKVEEGGRIERVMLWRFLLNLLEDPKNAPCIHWVQRDEGIFRILNTDWLARLWGRRHGNPRMTYEKMARAMR